ncbi:coiled-coil and C2 domain-containing protein 1-like isoform X2 [Chelonus insularis]|uniref:coiled-coil and C2 domain-containing protein 1-like isoform X2 n=1 Tax=Chelonus insularis TaxID=460826 RepID=UPI0015892B37|nr:coiled-coil and C2 domain-containing protein 1-like isoform X2 [Chelonus insularis]
MFSKKKERKQARKLDDPFGFDLMGSFDATDIGNDNGDDDLNDEDLEAELNQLILNNDGVPPRRPERKSRPQPINLEITDDIEVGSDEEPGDDDDPELLSELKSIVGDKDSLKSEENMEETPATEQSSGDATNQDEIIKILEERLEVYTVAEQKAKNNNEMSKVRRFSRGVKTLQGMLRDAKAGRNVDSADIPPPLPPSATRVTDNSAKQGLDSVTNPQEVVTDANPPENSSSEAPAPESEASAPEPEVPVPETEVSAPVIDEEKLELLKKRQQEYRVAAVTWKRCGNIEEAVKLVKIAKQFDVVINAYSSGQPVDLSAIPSTPELPGTTVANDSPATHENEKSESETQESSVAPITGDGIAKALQDRLEFYQKTKVTAEEQGNSSKARRYGRICKQYENAIKLHARGKPIPVDELPVPIGFPPIVLNVPTPASPEVKEEESPEPSEGSSDTKPTPPPRTKPAAPGITKTQKQTLLLQKRQIELKRAALMAKKNGNLEQARDYLRQAKGIDPLIQASRCGLPVDMSSIPLSPNAQTQMNDENVSSSDGFALISTTDCETSEPGTAAEIYENLEKLLVKQKKTCLATRDHCKAIGDVPEYNRWERMALGYSRDLDMLRVRKWDGLPPPQHHYEQRTHAIVKCCTDLTDNDLEISIIRGVNYSKEADTYVIYEFPHPSDRPPSDRTSTIKNSCNPEYDATFTLTGSVDRSSRQCLRAFKRHALKCQVWSKGGFLRSDTLLGTVTVKLQPLETQCVLHDSFPLMNGRKAAGGKLEVKIRLRNPIVTKQIEKMTERWLVIDK